MAILAVGPVTAKALRDAGVQHFAVAPDTNAASVIEALEQHFASATKAVPAGVKRA
jgi:uroporphyrinogen-III synthase